jgi:hypothetical protein
MMEVHLNAPLEPARLRSMAVRRVVLRELRGHDELMDLASIGATVRLIDELLVATPHAAVGPGQAHTLSLPDHDVVLAALYRELFGDEVACRIHCEGCGDALSVGFSLAELLAARHETTAADRAVLAALRGPDDDGVYELAASMRFRLPTCADVAELHGLPSEVAERALEQRCVLAFGSGDRDALDRAMALAGPRVATELDTECPRCGHQQRTPFDIEAFLCAALERERALVIREVHVLARAYGWSRADILDMARSDRRLHVRLILAEREAGGAWS